MRIGVSREAPIFYFRRMKIAIIVALTPLMLVLTGCSSEKKEIKETEPVEQEVVEVSTMEEGVHTTKSKERTLEEKMAYDDIPFTYPCDFDFRYMEVIKVSESRYEEIIASKGWDSGKGSCTWVYGEHIYNNFFPDSIITEYRTHLVDLDSSQIELTPEFLQSKLFKSHVIATTINGKGIFKTIWDPNKTGKYPKPVQWVGD